MLSLRSRTWLTMWQPPSPPPSGGNAACDIMTALSGDSCQLCRLMMTSGLGDRYVGNWDWSHAKCALQWPLPWPWLHPVSGSWLLPQANTPVTAQLPIHVHFRTHILAPRRFNQGYTAPMHPAPSTWAAPAQAYMQLIASSPAAVELQPVPAAQHNSHSTARICSRPWPLRLPVPVGGRSSMALLVAMRTGARPGLLPAQS